jgi:hypothetical protein
LVAFLPADCCDHLLAPNARTCESFQNSFLKKIDRRALLASSVLARRRNPHVVIVYRDVERLANARAFLDECAAGLRATADGKAADHGQATQLLIDFGELETAVSDALFPSADGASQVTDDWRRASVALGHMFVASWLQLGSRALRGRARKTLELIEALRPTLQAGPARLRVPEGYAYYAVYPETYIAAAKRFVRGRCPGRAVCLGLRSIGTSLSAAVAAGLEAEGWRIVAFTLRPRGHPFQRRPILTRELSTRVKNLKHAYFLIIDEGPGLSGSSFCGTAEVLSELSIPAHRIVLFPSWPADGSTFNSEAARHRWRLHPKVCCSFEGAWAAPRELGAMQDLSGGAWRRHCYPDEACYPAVQPQHERRKYLVTSPPGERILLKFAGLGRYGSTTYTRAERLAEAGFTPPVLGLREGFLMQTFVPGQPLRRADVDADLMRRAAGYLAHLRRRFVCERHVSFDGLSEMIDVNVTEGLGPGWRHRLNDLDRFRVILANVPAVAVDGRMLPHEWLRTPHGILKTDAIDHHDDHFFPGPQDIAWDVAGFSAEFGLHERATRDFAGEVAALSGDRSLKARLPFYRIAYLAHRFGYASMAARTLGASQDGKRMAALVRRYRQQLRVAIAGLGDAHSARVGARRSRHCFDVGEPDALQTRRQ